REPLPWRICGGPASIGPPLNIDSAPNYNLKLYERDVSCLKRHMRRSVGIDCGWKRLSAETFGRPVRRPRPQSRIFIAFPPASDAAKSRRPDAGGVSDERTSRHAF